MSPWGIGQQYPLLPKTQNYSTSAEKVSINLVEKSVSPCPFLESFSTSHTLLAFHGDTSRLIRSSSMVGWQRWGIDPDWGQVGKATMRACAGTGLRWRPDSTAWRSARTGVGHRVPETPTKLRHHRGCRSSALRRVRIQPPLHEPRVARHDHKGHHADDDRGDAQPPQERMRQRGRHPEQRGEQEGHQQAQRVNRREDEQELFPRLGRGGALRRKPKIDPRPDLMDIPGGEQITDPADQG